MSITKLSVSDLYKKCDLSKFDFNSTAELQERLSSLGQDRAISAVELGINIKSKGYNLFCFGPEGTGKMSLVKRILEKRLMIMLMYIILMNPTNRLPFIFPQAKAVSLPKKLMI